MTENSTNLSRRYPQRPSSKLEHCRSIQAALCAVTDALADAGVASAAREASLLMQHATGRTHESVLCALQDQLPQVALARLGTLLQRRLAGEPLQYILGEWWFYGRRFFVGPQALIPRPETEVLVECAIRLAPSLPRMPAGRLMLADIGTGSGILAITLAEEIEGSRVIASDISAGALRLAAANCSRHPAGSRVQLVRCDMADGFAPCFGGIVANLPYVTSAEMPELPREIREHEPAEALHGGGDGLSHLRRMVSDAPRVLLSGGRLLLEVGCGQADAVAGFMRSSRFGDIEVTPDLAGIPRVVAGRLGSERRPGD